MVRRVIAEGVIDPHLEHSAVTGKHKLGGINGQRINLGSFLSAIVYFVIFMAVIYFVLVVPYRAYMKKRGSTVFGDAPPTQTCPACLSDDLPEGAAKCKHCASNIPAAA